MPKITKPNITRKKLLNLHWYKKRTRKMLMKLTLGSGNGALDSVTKYHMRGPIKYYLFYEWPLITFVTTYYI